jgi:hypothetical protein
VSDKKTVVSLRTVAERVGLAPCSVSAVLNHSPASSAIPQRTRERIFRAARDLNYRPNLWARSLRTKRTRLIAVISADIGSAYSARVIAGAHRLLHRRGYLLALGTFDCGSEWSTIPLQLQQRGIEGVIAVDAILPHDLELPVASVDLDYMKFPEPLAEETQGWLSELGETAAETIVRQIEKENSPRRIKVAPNPGSEYFDLSNPSLGVEPDIRERAR